MPSRSGNCLGAAPSLVQQEASRYHGHLLLPRGVGVVLSNIGRKQLEERGLDQALSADCAICQDEITETVDAEEIQGRPW